MIEIIRMNFILKNDLQQMFLLLMYLKESKYLIKITHITQIYIDFKYNFEKTSKMDGVFSLGQADWGK